MARHQHLQWTHVVGATALAIGLAVVPAVGREPVIDPYYANRQAAQQRYADESSYDAQAMYEDEAGYDAGYEGDAAYEPEVIGAGEYAPDFQSSGPVYSPDGCGVDGCYGPDGYGGACGVDMGEYGACYGDGSMCADPAACGPQMGPGALWLDVNSKYKWWVGVDYLNWWGKGNYLPALVTTSPIGTSQAAAGVLGEPGTSVLFGESRYNGDIRYGGRIRAGWWIAEGEFLALEGGYYNLATETTRFGASSDFSIGDPNARILARPYTDATTGTPTRRLLAYPTPVGGGTLNGSVSAELASDVQSANLGLRGLLFVDFVKDHRSFITGGYRFFKLDESLLITDNFFPLGSQLFPDGSQFPEYDSFRTSNSFNGGYVGLMTDWRYRRISLLSNLQLSMGNMHQIVEINGQRNTTIPPNPQVTIPGGLLTQPSNIGKFSRDQFVLIPEVEFTLGFQWTNWLKTTVGYNFTYVTRVARPGNQVSLNVNNNQIASPEPAQPAFRFNSTDFWLQGITTGAEIRW